MRDAKAMDTCTRCGRDTAARDRLCGHCRGGPAARFADKREAVRRRTINLSELTAEDWAPPDPYHGDLARDDV